LEKVAPLRTARFPKGRRLLNRGDFLRVQEQGAGAGGSHFVVVIHPNPVATGQGSPARLGIVASRKVGGAVTRNRGKRLVREWFRRSCTELLDMDIVVILRLGANELSAGQAAEELDATLRRAQKKARRVFAG
jgi:ribonuclease P protein component